jgi:hypothetical protein
MLRITLATAAIAASLGFATGAHAFGHLPANGASLDGISASVKATMQRADDGKSAALPAIGGATDAVSFLSFNGTSLDGMATRAEVKRMDEDDCDPAAC